MIDLNILGTEEVKAGDQTFFISPTYDPKHPLRIHCVHTNRLKVKEVGLNYTLIGYIPEEEKQERNSNEQ